MKPKSLSLIITTYNWPEALDLVLDSVKNQSDLPDEIIIADDGSTQETADLVAYYQRHFSVPVIHSWQEDTGFRLSRSRNRAIAKAQGEYIVMIDGDMLLHPHFIRDHKQAAKRGQFIQGRRTLLTQELSKQALSHKQHRFSTWASGIKNKLNALRIPFLSPLISKLFSKQSYYSVRGCNMSMWRRDLITVNGFNEDFVGWGREDSEFVLRMLNNGISRYDLRLGGVAYHLYHKENTRDKLDENDELLEKAVKMRQRTCQHGLKDHL